MTSMDLMRLNIGPGQEDYKFSRRPGASRIRNQKYCSNPRFGGYSKRATLLTREVVIMLRSWKLRIVVGLLFIQAGFGPDRNPAVKVTEAATVQRAGMFEATGEITYRERIALPPQSVAVVTLRDVTVENAASTVIAEQRIDLSGRQVPIAFRVAVDRAKLQAQRKYSIRGTILGPESKVLWTTTDVHLVDPTKPSVALGTLTMSRITGDAADPEARLRSGEWTVVRLNGVEVPKGARATLNFGASGALTGRSFCNSYVGTYVLSGGSLSLSPKATTLMACPSEVANLEKQFLELLRVVQRYEMSEFGTLTLRTSDLRTITASRL